MKLKVPPAIQFAVFAFSMWLLDRWLPANHIEFGYQSLVSWIVFALGVAMGITAVLSFKKAQTTVDPTRPDNASSLVVVGLYRYTRNPMYLAMLIVLLAYAVRLGNLYTLVMVVAYVLFITEFQIKPEEKALTALFGDDYTSYKNSVRRWI